MMEFVINCAVELLVNIFDMYIIYRYMTIFFSDRVINKRLTTIVYIVRFVSLFAPVVIGFSPLSGFITYVISIYMIVCCYKTTRMKKAIVTLMVVMFAFAGEIVIALIVGLSAVDLHGQIAQMDSLCKVIMELVFWSITLVVQRFKNVNSNVAISKVFLVAIVVIPISSICLEFIIFQQENIDSNMAKLSLVCVLATNFTLIYLYDSFSKLFQERTQAVIAMKEKEYYHEQAEVLKIQYEELRQFRHDFKNRMLVIEQLINENKISRLLEYTRLITEKLEVTNAYSTSGKLAIDSVINYKLSRACEEGISIRCDVIIPETLCIDEDDIVVILGNLLDNAIEATKKLSEDRYVYIDVSYDKGMLLIHIENSYNSVVYRQGKRFLTSKKNQSLHGIGLQSIDTIVAKYDGQIDIDYENGIFVVDVMLYL